MNPYLAMQRIGLIAGNTFREALHQRSLGLMLLVALGFTGGAWGFRQFNFGASELKFIADLGLGALALFGALLAIGATVQTFFTELEGRTLHLLWARGVTRGEFVLGKLVGIQLLLALFSAVLLACLIPLLWAREAAIMSAAADSLPAERLLSLTGVLLAAGALWLKCGVLTAAVLAVCSFAGSRLYVLVCGFLLLIIFHSGAILTVYEANSAGIGQWAVMGLKAILPDFAAFDLTSTVFADARLLAVTGQLILYAAIYMVGFCFIAVRLLRAREI